MYCVRNTCLCVVIVLLYSSLVRCSIVNITLNATEIASMDVPSVVVSDTVSIQCQTSGQNTYQVYNLSPAQFNTCAIDSQNIIGHCINSPLTINIVTLAMLFPGQVSYVAGTTYYYAVFETNSYGQISSNQPCMDGLKFSIDVVSPAVSSSDTFLTSTITYYTTSFSYVQSSTAKEVSSTFTSSASSASSSSSSSIQSVTATYSTTASTQTSSSSSGSSSDTLTIEPSIANIASSADKNVPVYIGTGAAGGIVIAVIISIIVIIAVGTCVIRYRQRNNEPYYIKDTMEKGDTLRPMLNSPTHSAPESEYETITNDNNNSIPITFQQNNKHFSQQISTQSEEESIKSTTSMDPLLGPSSPTALSYTIPLNTIHEVAITNNKDNNDSIEDNTSGTTNTDTSLYVTSSFNNTAKDVNDNGVVSTSDNSAVSSFDNNLLNLQHHFETNGEQQYHSIDERTNSNP